MGPVWGRQDPGGRHVGPMNFAMWVRARVVIMLVKEVYPFYVSWLNALWPKIRHSTRLYNLIPIIFVWVQKYMSNENNYCYMARFYTNTIGITLFMFKF